MEYTERDISIGECDINALKSLRKQIDDRIYAIEITDINNWETENCTIDKISLDGNCVTINATRTEKFAMSLEFTKSDI